jgi:phosphoribosylglycinamide formyltransferase-1
MSLKTDNRPLRVAVGISGSGRTLLNLLKNQYPLKDYQVIGVFASSPTCLGIKYAHEFSIPILVERFHGIPHTADPLVPPHPVYHWLEEIGADCVALAGFLKPFPVWKNWENRVVNIHPALLPKFGGHGMYGLKVHQAILDQKETVTGATVHFVTEEYDRGEIIAQVQVPILPDDSAQILADRVFKAECELYPQVLDRFKI